jgi:small subunit ribosomal protein S5
MNTNRFTVSRSQNDEFSQRVLEVKRVTRVVAGGKRMSFRAVVVVGDKQGRVGVGVAKGKDYQRSVEKSARQAKKRMVLVPLVNGTIPAEVRAKHSSAVVILKPARKGRGFIAGGAARAVLSVAGVRNITAKILGRTTNKLTNAMATLKALEQLAARYKSEPEKEKQTV